MTHVISPGSPHHAAARAFAITLRRAMAKHRLGPKSLARICGVNYTSIWHYESARSFPELEAARKLADALEDETLVEIVLRERTSICPCGNVFVTNRGPRRRFCSDRCARRMREGKDLQLTPTVARHRLTEYRGAVEQMCFTCTLQIDGLCRNSSCALRPVSPLPLAAQT